MKFRLRRRDLIRGIGGVAAGWPLAARGQQTIPIFGFLNGQTAAGFAYLAAAFRQGLSEMGFNEGQNARIEYRWADGDLGRVRALADDLVQQQVAVIAAGGGAHVVARDLTTIPIVFAIGGDPVRAGLVKSINRPGGNATGVMVFTTDLEAKRLELLHELAPRTAIIGVLIDPSIPHAPIQLQEVEAAARVLGRQLQVLNVSTDAEMDRVGALVAKRGITALAAVGNPFFLNRRARLLELVGRLRLPAIFENREFTAGGGLMSYGTSVPDVYRQIGVYAGRIAKGERAADLPVLQPSKFDIAVNLRTAKALGIDVPTSILLRADEVIE